MTTTHHTNSLIRDVIIPEEIAVLKRTIRRLVDRANQLEGELRGALCLLDHVDASNVTLHWGKVSEFMADRRQLNHNFEEITKLPIEALGSPVKAPNPLD
jgi:predicted phage-related endonuclease